MQDLRVKKIIIADDNQTFLMYIGLLLKRMGFSVIPAENGLEVLKLLKIIEPDVIMLDIEMGTIDGVTALRYIKEDNRTLHIPVIMLSSDSSGEAIERCRRLGCADYLTKPVVLDKLHAALEGCNIPCDGAKRRHVRVPFNKKVLVTYNGTHHHLYTETLAEGGVYIRKQDPFPIGAEVDVTLPLNDGESIRLPGTVVHVRGLFGDILKVPPGMGIQFTEITDNEAGVLKNYIEKLIAWDIMDDQEENIIKPNDGSKEADPLYTQKVRL